MQELTAMQAANWAARRNSDDAQGVSAHLYAEFDAAGLDADRLQAAVRRLYQAHPMLRLRVTAEGRQVIEAPDARHGLTLNDLRDHTPDAMDQALAALRVAKSHQRLALEDGQAADLTLSLLPGGRQRLHIDIDMIAADPSCFGGLMDDLARFYDTPLAPDNAPAAGYFAYLDRMQADPDRAAQRSADLHWWRARLDQIPPAPALPVPSQHGTLRPDSVALSAQLDATQKAALLRIARRHHVTPSTLMLALFAALLGRATAMQRFRLTVPMFHRDPLVDGAQRLTGDFAEMTVLGVDLAAADTLAGLCKATAAQMAQLISHSACSGISILRDLSRHHGSMQAAPVVFTAGLDVPGGSILSDRALRVFGPLVWVISQGPGVALDAQVAALGTGIHINWDVRRDLVAEPWVQALFTAYTSALRDLAARPDAIAQGVDAWLARHLPTTAEQPLTSLQKAYLLGRERHLPLGGVAMQEFREYRGDLPLDSLRTRLAALVAAHPALRARIDTLRLVQYTDAAVLLNLDVTDLRDLTPAAAEAQIAALRQDYAHQICDLARAPWHMLAFLLPDGAGDSLTLFARFDALILDGQAIAHLMHKLATPAAAAPLLPERPAGPDQYADDAAYWDAKLQDVAGPPRLPYLRAPDTIAASRYQRASLTVARDDLARITRIGAAQHLFRNATLSAVILEVLARWTPDLDLCIGIPVAPAGAGGPLGNPSSFIAVQYRVNGSGLAGRAARLQADILDGLAHPGFSGVDISRLLLNRAGGGLPLPVVLTNGLSWERPGQTPLRLVGGLTQTPQVAMDIRLSLDAERNLMICIDHAEAALDSGFVQDLLHAIGRAFTAICTSGNYALTAADFVDTPQYRHNGSDGDFRGAAFLERIARHLFDGALHTPALICDGQTIPYAALGQSIARIIAALRARGLGAGDVVAICLPRSPDHVVLTLACALEGIIWVPVDAASPPDRLAYLLAHCAPDLVVSHLPVTGWPITTPATLQSGTATASPLPYATLAERSHSEAAAYYLFTSGTTGKPKCVVLTNRATSNVIGQTLRQWDVTPQDVLISVTPLHHDMSVFDLFGALAAGAALVLPGVGEEKDAVRWNQLVQQHGVTLWSSVPAILEMLLACQHAGSLRSLRIIAQGGDYVKPATIASLRGLLPGCRLISLGGPTETTIWSIWHEITPEDTAIIPYGRPLPALRYFICNDAGEHCPPGVLGRIHTAGVGLALGYLEGGAVVQTDFVALADEAGLPVRAFRTGDQGYYRADGSIIFASRVNGYVKVRGVRVSLTDVENELGAHPAIRHLLVVDYAEPQSGEVALALLYVAGAPVTQADLRRFARQHLPETHVPTRYLAIAELPLSANGKPDRRRARDMVLAGAGAPQPPTPTRIARVLDIYITAIGKPRPAGVTEHSPLLALGLLPSHLKPIAAQLRDAFGVTLSPARLIPCKTAQQVAQLVDASQ